MASGYPCETAEPAPDVDDAGTSSAAAAACPAQSTAGIEPQTPAPTSTKKKVVRFSDPGPTTQAERTHLESSTGLTPHVSRARIGADDDTLYSPPPPDSKTPSTKTKKARRHTAPASNYETELIDLETLPSPGSCNVYRFIPLHDQVRGRSARRIRRLGLSEEMNRISEVERSRKRKERDWEQELTSLKRRLSHFESAGPVAENDTAGVEHEGDPTRRRLFDSTTAETAISDDAGSRSPTHWVGDSETLDSDGTSIMMDDDTTMGTSTLDTPLTTLPTTPTDAAVQTSFTDPCREAELEKLNKELERELELRKLDNRQLFKEWQEEVHSEECAGIIDDDAAGSGSTPPPDLGKQIIATLKAADTRASDAIRGLGDIFRDLSSHGFDGADVPDIMESVGAHFRHARIELERGQPGETIQADFSNWKEILEALVERVNSLVQNLHEAREQITGCEGREAALRRQFDATLLRLEDETKKNASLEEYSGKVAEDMLHARMKIQNLDKVKENQESDKVRLQEALEKYREDVRTLEELNSQLEDQVATLERSSCKSRDTIVDLRADLLREQETNKQTQSRLDQRNVDISNLQIKIRDLEAEKDAIVLSLERKAEEQSQRHEQEVGVLNSRLSETTTSLDEAVHKRECLLKEKVRIEDQLNGLEHLFSHVSKATQGFAEWRRGKNQLETGFGDDTEPEDDDTHHNDEVGNRQSFTTIGGEPITPATESRFKNVVFARGKKRKRCHVDTLPEEDEDAD